MEQTTINETVFLKECFFLCFYTDEEYEKIKKFIDTSGDTFTFRFAAFIDNLKSQRETMGIIPIDVLYSSSCTTDVLKKIEDSFEAAKNSGGYTRLFLEYLFDERFRTEFNKLIKEQKPTFSNNYFSTKNEIGIFDDDMVGDYFDKIKELYKGADGGYDFSSITVRHSVYSKHFEKKKNESNDIKGWTEPLNNVFSMFKLYGQEKYSRVLISLLERYNGDERNLLPETMINKSSDIVLGDEEIKKTLPKNDLPEILKSRIIFLELQKLQEELQRFFDDYKPSHLDRIFVLNSEAHKNETLRELLVRDFKGILKEELNLYRKVGCDPVLYEELSERRNFYKYYELQLIEEEFNRIANKDSTTKIKVEDCSLPDKISYIMRNSIELIHKPIWNTIFEKFKEYYPLSLDDVLNYEEKVEDKNNYDEWEKKLKIEEKLKSEENSELIEPDFNNTQIYGVSGNNGKYVLLSYFKKYFKGENQFLSNLSEDLWQFRDDVMDFLTGLKGSSEHPWGRFWRVYTRNSEINLYTEKKLFTRVMNRIEQNIMNERR